VLRILVACPRPVRKAAPAARGHGRRRRVEAELLNRLERSSRTKLSGLVDFGLENRNLEGSSGDVETRWRIGRYLPGGFYISYNQGLSMDSIARWPSRPPLQAALSPSEVVNRARFADEGVTR